MSNLVSLTHSKNLFIQQSTENKQILLERETHAGLLQTSKDRELCDNSERVNFVALVAKRLS